MKVIGGSSDGGDDEEVKVMALTVMKMVFIK